MEASAKRMGAFFSTTSPSFPPFTSFLTTQEHKNKMFLKVSTPLCFLCPYISSNFPLSPHYVPPTLRPVHPALVTSTAKLPRHPIVPWSLPFLLTLLLFLLTWTLQLWQEPLPANMEDLFLIVSGSNCWCPKLGIWARAGHWPKTVFSFWRRKKSFWQEWASLQGGERDWGRGWWWLYYASTLNPFFCR